MVWQFVVLNEEGRKGPHGVVVHKEGARPTWVTTSKAGERMFKVLFNRESVFANTMRGDGTFDRMEKTYDDSDYLDYASTKVSLPLFVQTRGVWTTEMSKEEQVLSQLANRFLGDDNV